MTVKPLGNGTYIGLSSDTKPVAANTAINAIFQETDTHDTYINNGTAWLLFSADNKTETLTNKTMHNDSNTLPYVGGWDSVIYKSGSTYKSKKMDGTLLASSTTLDGVVQAALDLKGRICWMRAADGSSYTPSGAVAWDILEDTWLSLGEAYIVVPGTYSGTLFRVSDRSGGADHVARRIVMDGGFVQQGSGTPSALWTALELESTSSTVNAGGVTFCQFRNLYFKRMGVGVRLKADSGTNSFITGVTFDSITLDNPHEGFVFQTTGAIDVANQVASRNTFINCISQADKGAVNPQYQMANGYKDIAGKNNAFYHCKSWDTVEAHGVASNLTTRASDTLISGGLMTAIPYHWEISQDRGLRTRIENDPFNIGSVSVFNPLIRKVGTFGGPSGTAGTSAEGDGLLSTITPSGTISTVFTTDGIAKRMETAATANAVARISGFTAHSCRYYDPLVRFRFKLNQITNQKIFVGFSNNPTLTINTADDPLQNLTGYGLYHSTINATSATNWLVCKNAGSASSTMGNSGTAANVTTVQNILVAGWEDTPLWTYRIDPNAYTSSSATGAPAQLTGLVCGIWIANSGPLEAKQCDVYAIYLKHGKAEGPGPGGAD